MKLLENWKTILRQAWSVRMALLSAAFAIFEAVLPFLANGVVPPGIFALLSALSAAGSVGVRVLDQKLPK